MMYSTRAILQFFIVVASVLFSTHSYAFVIYDATAYTGKPNLSTLGIIHLPNVDDNLKYDAAGLPIKDSFKNTVMQKSKGASLIFLDYESYPLTPDKLISSRTKLQTILQWAHEAAPGVKFGFYAIPPISSYWGPVSAPTTTQNQEWIKGSDDLSSLAQQVDVIFPSLYTFYTDQQGWEMYAIGQITQARKYGKPIYVFLWPQYHNSNFLLGTKFLPRDYWRRELDVAYKYADGIVIWGGWDFKKNAPLQWDENAEWWQETKSFIAKTKAPAAPTPPQPSVTQ